MDQSDMLSFYKWLTSIGVVIFVAFSYVYFDAVTSLQNELGDLNQQIETQNATIDNTTNTNTKRELITANIARAENASNKSTVLNINRIVVLVFVLAGLGLSAYGLTNIRKLVSDSEEEEV